MAKGGNRIDIDELRRLIHELSEIMKENDLSEVSFEREGFKISLKRTPDLTALLQTALAQARAKPELAVEERPAIEAEEEEFEYITAPMPGTFYRAPSPGAKPFVEVGDVVRGRSDEYEGDTVCIIEAMKVMNEIKPEFDCQIVEILVENGQRVEYGQRLFKVKRV